MKNNTASNEETYKPFPFNMHGQFCEINTENETVFIEARATKYDNYQVERLKQINSLDESVIGSYLALLKNKEINFQTRHLYKLQVYKANPASVNPWEFNESITEYEEIGFLSLDNLLDYCKQRFGIGREDFVPIHKTHIPN